MLTQKGLWSQRPWVTTVSWGCVNECTPKLLWWQRTLVTWTIYRFQVGRSLDLRATESPQNNSLGSTWFLMHISEVVAFYENCRFHIVRSLSANLITNKSTDKRESKRLSSSFANCSYHTTTTRSLEMALTIRGRFITTVPPKMGLKQNQFSN